MNACIKIIFLLLLFHQLSQNKTFAQNNSLTYEDYSQFYVDRPGIADSPYIIGINQWQVETGVDYFYRNDKQRWNIPTTFIRTGLTPNTELRISAKFIQEDSLVNQQVMADYRVLGLGYMTIGIKTVLLPQKEHAPQIALLADIYLPFIGENTFRPLNSGHDIIVLFDQPLTSKMGLNYNIGAIWEGFKLNPVWTYSLCLNITIAKKWATFVEHYAFLEENGTEEYGGDVGIMFVPKNYIQLDISAGTSFIQEKQYHFTSAGISFKIDRHKNKVLYGKKEPHYSIHHRAYHNSYMGR